MSGLPSPFTCHFCPTCGEQCSCTDARVWAGPEEEEVVEGCAHDRPVLQPPHPVDECCACANCLAGMGTYKPGHSGGFPF